MSEKRFIQLVAGYSRGDAISNTARTMRGLFRTWGYSSEIVSEKSRILTELFEDSWTIEQYQQTASADDIVLLHLSIGSPINDFFKTLPGRKIIFYHNITPPHFFEGLEQTRPLEEGHIQTKDLAGIADLNLAVSRFNASELEAMGYTNVQILPLFIDFDALKKPTDKATLQRYRDGHVNILFVGRCVPNKRIEDLLCTFYYFQRFVEPRSRLIHVGSFSGTEQYHAMLLAFAHDLALERVDMLGSVPQAQLNAIYSSADVFLSMSEHEGFCIPLLESMAHDVPVVAYAAGAVQETLDGTGILLKEKRFDLVAECLGQLTRNKALRKSLLDQQKRRLQRYQAAPLADELKQLVTPFL